MKHKLRAVVSVVDERVATRLAELLQDELVSAEVVNAPPLSWEVWVPEDEHARAKAILDAAYLTEGELVFLATGEL